MLKGKAQICILGMCVFVCVCVCVSLASQIQYKETDREAGEGHREKDARGLFMGRDGKGRLCVSTQFILNNKLELL